MGPIMLHHHLIELLMAFIKGLTRGGNSSELVALGQVDIRSDQI